MPMIRQKLERVTAGDVRSQMPAQLVVRKPEEMRAAPTLDAERTPSAHAAIDGSVVAGAVLYGSERRTRAP
jgi:hypothetical protein